MVSPAEAKVEMRVKWSLGGRDQGKSLYSKKQWRQTCREELKCALAQSGSFVSRSSPHSALEKHWTQRSLDTKKLWTRDIGNRKTGASCNVGRVCWECWCIFQTPVNDAPAHLSGGLGGQPSVVSVFKNYFNCRELSSSKISTSFSGYLAFYNQSVG